jgi:hypothetical protein
VTAPHRGQVYLRAVLTRRAQRAHLMQIEIDWPGSRGLLERLAAGLSVCYATDAQLCERLSLIVTSAIAAYGAAKRARLPDRERFVAFVAGMTAVLDTPEHPALALAIAPFQRRVLGGRLRAVGKPDPAEPADA